MLLAHTPSPVFGEGAGWGPFLQIQNYMDIDNINAAKENSSTRKASPSRFTGGGVRGWVPLEGARFYRFSTSFLSKNDLIDLINEGIPPMRSISPNPMRSRSGARTDATSAPTIAPIVPPTDIMVTAP